MYHQLDADEDEEDEDEDDEEEDKDEGLDARLEAFGCTRRIKLQRIQGATDIHVSDTKCYWHIKDALRKRKSQMKDPKSWETIKAMLDDVSNLGIPVLKEKLQEFMVAEMTKIEKVWTKEYFLKEGYDKKKYSYSDRPPGIPRTDNALERMNMTEKEDNVYKVMMSMHISIQCSVVGKASHS